MKTLAIAFALLISGGVFLVSLLVILLKKRKYLLPFLFGICTFFVFQMVLRLPLLTKVQQLPQIVILKIQHPFYWVFILGISAAIFEECGRWLVMRFLLKKHTTPTDGLLFGIGHGSFEALAIVSPSYIMALFTASSPLWQAATPLLFSSGIERFFTILFHIGASIMVMKSVREKKPLWLLFALFLHAFLNIVAACLQLYGFSIFIIECFIATVGIGMLVYTIFSIKIHNIASHRKDINNEKND